MGILAAAGIGWICWLLFSAPQVDAFSDRPEQCYSIFQLPREASDPADRRFYDNQGALTGLSPTDISELVRNSDDCNRERSYRLAISTLAGIPTVVLASTAIAIGTRRIRGPAPA
jgi:hypothetical protein